MSRGHLVAYSDFVFNTQQQATMVFVNANPQWQTFNGQNWNYLEQDVRAFVGRVNQDLIVYTGSHVSLDNFCQFKEIIIKILNARAFVHCQTLAVCRPTFT